MKNDENRQMVDLLKNLYKAIREHGIKKIVKSLRDIDIEFNNEHHSQIIEYIVSSACEMLDVKKDKLFDFKTRGDVTVARKICILLFRKHLNLSDVDASAYFNRSRQVTHNTEMEFAAMDIQNKFDKDFLTLYNALDKMVSEYTSKLNQD